MICGGQLVMWPFQKKPSPTVLSHGTIYLVNNSNFFSISAWSLMINALKWKLFSCSFPWCYYMFVTVFMQSDSLIFGWIRLLPFLEVNWITKLVNFDLPLTDRLFFTRWILFPSRKRKLEITMAIPDSGLTLQTTLWYDSQQTIRQQT